MACKCEKVVENVGNIRVVHTKKICAECRDKRETESKAFEKSRRKVEILAELGALDAKSIRPLRAKVSGIATAEDETILSDINTKIVALRAELTSLK